MPIRLGDLERNLRALNVPVEKPNKGSHWKCKLPDGRTYPIPAHNGPKSVIDDVYLKKLAKLLGVDLSKLLGAAGADGALRKLKIRIEHDSSPAMRVVIASGIDDRGEGLLRWCLEADKAALLQQLLDLERPASWTELMAMVKNDGRFPDSQTPQPERV